LDKSFNKNTVEFKNDSLFGLWHLKALEQYSMDKYS
jgi:hypothetical protein